jgi:hypothetical protein
MDDPAETGKHGCVPQAGRIRGTRFHSGTFITRCGYQPSDHALLDEQAVAPKRPTSCVQPRMKNDKI